MKNKTTAAILAFFLGYFGAHRFYLGQIGLGFVYLVLCWTPIIWIVTIIDFIAFLTMSEDSFNMKYNRMYSLNSQQPQVVVNTSYHSGTPPFPQNPSSVESKEKAVDNTGNSTLEEKIDPFEKSGNKKYEEYDFDGAIKDYLKSLNINSKKPEVHFKLACIYSILEKTDNSLFHLSKAIEKGFYDFEKIKTHDHLAFLRSKSEFDNFVDNGYKVIKQISEPKNNGLDLSDSVITQIERLAKMRDSGVINEEEFQSQKTKLLGN